MLANPPVAVLFCVLRAIHLVAPEPPWFYVCLTFAGGAIAVLSRAMWGPRLRPWHLHAYAAVNMAVIAGVAYATGWGPILSIGFLFGTAGALRLYGSDAMWPALLWTTVCMALAEVAIDAVACSGLDPALLCLEITEGTLTRDEGASAEALLGLRALGAHLSIDDFGTGYSSLGYLMRFPIDSLKVDQSFVTGLGEHADNLAIVEAVIGLAHSLGLVAVAEGVETETAMAELRRLGCDRAQGYLVGAPDTADAVAERFFGRGLRASA